MKLRAISEDRQPEPNSSVYLHPDTWYDQPGAIVFICMKVNGNQQLFVGEGRGDSHYDLIIGEEEYFRELWSYLMHDEYLKQEYQRLCGYSEDGEEFKLVYNSHNFSAMLEGSSRDDTPRRLCSYLFGRTGTDWWTGSDGHRKKRTIVSFWDKDKNSYDKLLQSCLEDLEHDGYITKPYFISTPIHGTVSSDVTTTKEMTPEDEEKYELYRRLHLMRGAEKRAAMKTLGLGGGFKSHGMATSMQKAGLRSPGQRWWAMNSESKKR